MNIQSTRQTLLVNNFYFIRNNKKYISLPKNVNYTDTGRIWDKFSDKSVIINPTFSKSEIYKLAQNNNLSFKGLEKGKDALACNELSDAEFEKMRPKVEEKLKEHNINIELNKYNIEIANKILSNEKLFNNENIINKVDNIIRQALTTERVKANLGIIDKILSDERLFNNENLMDKAGDIIYYTTTINGVKAKSDIIDKVLSDKRLYNNEKFMNRAGYIVEHTNTPEEAKIKSEIIDKILSDDRLFNNKNFMDKAGYIIESTNTQEQAKIKSDIIDKILSDDKLFNNKNFMDKAGYIIESTNTQDQAKITNKILSDERLYNNEKFINEVVNIIDSTSNLEKASAKSNMIDKILLDERLYNNENFMNRTVDIIHYTSTPEEATAKSNIIDKILSDERLYNNEKFINQAVNIIHYTSTPEEAIAKSNMIDKILLDEKFINKARIIIGSTYTPKQAKIKSALIDKIVSANLLEAPIRDDLLQLLSKSNPYEYGGNLDKFLDDYIKNGQEQHNELIQSALANKNLLKSGLEDISDEDVLEVMSNIKTAKTICLLGFRNTEAAFPLMLEEFKFFTNDVTGLNLSQENYERLIQKTNYKNSQKYAELLKKISTLKNELISSIPPENQSRMKKLQAQKEILDNKIKELKQRKDNDSKKELKDSQKQSKALGRQIQSIYFTSPNAKDLMKEISSKTKELNDMINTSKSLEPQEVVTKMRVLYALKKITSEEEMAYFIDLIKPSTSENNANWNNAVNKKIFKKLDIEFDEELSKKLNLINCPYLSKMFVSSEDFFDNMKILINVIKENPELSIEQVIDKMPQNIETKKIYEKLGIDYDKWTKVDKNSYTSVEIKLDAETAKQKAIENLEEDLNDELFKKLPKKVTEPILTRLEKNLGVTLVKMQKDIWEGDGFSARSSEYYRLYKNSKPIAFEDMKDIVSEIKKEINSNDFWTTKNKNPEIETARGTIYTHLIKMRTNEIDNALNMKDGETTEIEVRKADMYDLKKALGLGNDAQCCTALGRNSNEWSAPTYIMNKCIGAIELTDKGAFVGNTMIYIANVDGKPSLVLDNIELKTKYQNNDKIRDTFVDYAKKLCKEIGQPDLPIYAGPNRHKLNMGIYPRSTHNMEIIGNSADQGVYIDCDARGHKVGQGEIINIEMYKLR